MEIDLMIVDWSNFVIFQSLLSLE